MNKTKVPIQQRLVPPGKGRARRSASLLVLCLVGWAQFSVGQTLTPGEQFRQRMAKLEADCKRNPPTDPRNTRCDPLKIKPEDWLATPEGRFAHSIKIPNPVPDDSGYQKGMTPAQYFEHLCKNEAGEFIFKTVDNVEGIRLLRPREPVDDYVFQHLYAIEDPYGHMQEEVEDPGFHFLGPRKYVYVETPVRQTKRHPAYKKFYHPSVFFDPPAGQAIERYFFDGPYNDRKNMQLQYDVTSKARYGVTWRGIRRSNDREMGISGGELIVLDLEKNEVLGIRRGYALYRGSWEITPLCPHYGYFGGFDKASGFSSWFTMKVARPLRWREWFEANEATRRIRADQVGPVIK
jgi:hypothetical protein